MADALTKKRIKQRRGTKRPHSSEDDTLEVVCRIKHCANECPNPCVVALDDELVQLVPPPQRLAQGVQEKTYRFGYAFDTGDSQRAVFHRCCLDFCEDLVRGRSGLLFAYGVTSSGKTYTMTGSPTDSGILPRAADVIFNSIDGLAQKCVFYPDGRNGFRIRSQLAAAEERDRTGANYLSSDYQFVDRLRETKAVPGFNYHCDMAGSVFVSYVEIYNDNCYDLLDRSLNAESSRLNMAKRLCTDPVTGQVYVSELTEVEVSSSDEVLEQYRQAQERRKVAATLLNTQSSRSHSVFTIRLVRAPAVNRAERICDRVHPVEDESKIIVSQLVLVDLAGSERTKRTCNEGDRLAEAGKINQSLSNLRKCFDQLREKQRGCLHPATTISYRDAKLTHLFKHFLEGTGGRIRMIVCVNPQPSDYDENTFVMSFAELAQSVEIPDAAVHPPALEYLASLPYTRRQIDHWYREMAERVVEKPVSLDGEVEPTSPMPFVVKHADDIDQNRKMLESFQKILANDRAMHGTANSESNQFFTHLKQRLCGADLDRAKVEELRNDLDEVNAYNATLSAKNNQLEREINALRKRLYSYEADRMAEKTREVDKKKRDYEKMAAFEQQQRVMQKVADMMERPIPTTSHVATLAKKFCEGAGGSCEAVDRVGRGPKPPPHQQLKRQTPVLSGASRPSRQAVPNSAKTGAINPLYQRRSQSVGTLKALNHQPANGIPLGTVFQPQLPKGTKHTTQVQAGDLKQCDSYVVTTQQVDVEGNLTTGLVKGNIIPTAGGGSAVLFHDMECLRQEAFDTPPSS